MKNITVNFNLKQDNKIDYYISKELSHEKISEFVLNFYGEMMIGRSIPKELDIVITIYSNEDRKQIEQYLLNISCHL